MSLLPGLTQTAPGAPIYAPVSGGGGGGSGPNLTVSTITFGADVTTSLFFPSSVTQAIQCGALEFIGPTGSQIILDPNGIVPNPPMPSGSANIQWDGGSYILEDFNTSLLSIVGGNGNGDVSISSIYVSSVNGQPIGGGGGVGPNLTVSTLAAASWINVANQNGGSNNFRMESQNTQKYNLHIINGVANPGIQLDDAGIVSITNADFQVSSINGAIPGGGGGPTISTFPDVTVSSSIAVGKLAIQGSDTNLFSFTVLDSNAALVQAFNCGNNGGRNQFYINSNAQIQNDLWVSSISKCALANVSTLNVSSINGAVPGGSANLNNTITPWVPGFSLSGQRFLNVDSNTQGTPLALTNPVPTLSNHSYMVSYTCSGGSNADNSAPTLLQVLAPPAAPVYIRTYQGNGTYDFFQTGQAGSESAIIRGASSLQLVAGCGSATASTLMIFDDTQQFQITDLGVSS